MIKFHPCHEHLVAYTRGELPAAMAAAVAVHCELCPECRAAVAAMNEQEAENHFDDVESDDLLLDMNAMIEAITCDKTVDLCSAQQKKTLTVNERSYVLPKALTNVAIGKWSGLGNISRSRVSLDDGEIRASLLQILPGGSVPEHTHNGFEITVLLDGTFHDEMGEYHPGDFIMLTEDDHHNPQTTEGCLCYTVLNDALHFNRGMNKLLNPIGKLIY